MSTYNAFYVRKQAADEVTHAAILSLYPKARIEVSADFIGGVLSRDDIEPTEQKLAELSEQLETDVIWVTFQTTAESFIYHHWRSGSQLRALWYGCANEGTWERVEGEVEPWEAEEFWSQDALEDSLECAESDSERKKLERLWKDGIIRKGQTEPSVSSEDAVHAAMEHYGLIADAESPMSQPASQHEQKPKPKRKYGCLFVLLILIAVFVFAVIGIISLFR